MFGCCFNFFNLKTTGDRISILNSHTRIPGDSVFGIQSPCIRLTPPAGSRGDQGGGNRTPDGNRAPGGGRDGAGEGRGVAEEGRNNSSGEDGGGHASAAAGDASDSGPSPCMEGQCREFPVKSKMTHYQ